MSTINNLFGKVTSGTVYFTDGSTLEFSNFVRWGDDIYSEKKYVQINYQGTKRNINVDELSEFEILRLGEIKAMRDGLYLNDAEIKFVTVTGIKIIDCPYSMGWLCIYVNIYDELTGKNKVQRINFAEGKYPNYKLNIKRIIFN